MRSCLSRPAASRAVSRSSVAGLADPEQRLYVARENEPVLCDERQHLAVTVGHQTVLVRRRAWRSAGHSIAHAPSFMAFAS
jgi:hypothetical protein